MFCKCTSIIFVLNRISHVSVFLKVFIKVITQLIKLGIDHTCIIDQIRFGMYRTSFGKYTN